MQKTDVGEVWIIWRKIPGTHHNSIWEVCDDEYSGQKILNTLMNKSEFTMYKYAITHVVTERVI
jgi:hypothetical protein